jgi:uncharacterized membrane protein YesL
MLMFSFLDCLRIDLHVRVNIPIDKVVVMKIVQEMIVFFFIFLSLFVVSVTIRIDTSYRSYMSFNDLLTGIAFSEQYCLSIALIIVFCSCCH